MTGLAWGRRFLVCPPEHFGVLYQINPWMDAAVTVDEDRARAQWEELVATLREAGADVVALDPAPDLPDMVFTANAGIVDVSAPAGPLFVPSRFRHPERGPEADHFARWFAAAGWRVEPLPDGMAHEGAGDALPFGGTLVSAHPFRSDPTAARWLADTLGAPVHPLELVDERLYHVDLTFCPLDDRRALCAPLGWSRQGRRAMEELVPEPLWLTDEEALSFCANSVVVGSTVIMPATPVRVGRRLEAWGFDVVTCDVGEFLKAGGGCRCLTLALDVALHPASDHRT